MKSMTIGQVAGRMGIGVETVRFYEREGLIEAPARRKSGYRQFSEAVVPRLHFIKRARDLGFSLAEIRELLSLRVESSGTCAEVKQRVEAKIQEIDTKLESLQAIRNALEELVAACDGRSSSRDCRFLEALDGQAIDPAVDRDQRASLDPKASAQL